MSQLKSDPKWLARQIAAYRRSAEILRFTQLALPRLAQSKVTQLLGGPVTGSLKASPVSPAEILLARRPAEILLARRPAEILRFTQLALPRLARLKKK